MASIGIPRQYVILLDEDVMGSQKRSKLDAGLDNPIRPRPNPASRASTNAAPGKIQRRRLLVPDAAIGTEQVRKFVLVVDDGNVVRQKYVTLGQIDGGLRVVKDGLAVTDRVIVNGLMRARPGQKVTPQQEGAPTKPKGPNEANAG